MFNKINSETSDPEPCAAVTGRGEVKLCSGTGRNRSALWEHSGPFQGFGSCTRQSVCVHCQASRSELKEALNERGMLQHCGNARSGHQRDPKTYRWLRVLSFTDNKQHCSAFCGTHVSLMKSLPIWQVYVSPEKKNLGWRNIGIACKEEQKPWK